MSPEIVECLNELYPDAACALEFSSAYELMVATILSAQTTDKRVNEVTRGLFTVANTPESMLELGLDRLQALIQTCGLFRNKAANILAASRELVDRFGGEVPAGFDDLVSLPGVGRKTASVVVSNAFGTPAMAVDTHVFRVANRLGLAHGKTPDQVEIQLKEAIPRGGWIAAHHQLIAHGRTVCDAKRPRCGACGLSHLCEWALSQG